MNAVWIAIVALIVLRVGWRLMNKNRKTTEVSKKPLKQWQRKYYTVWAFFTINLRRVFRDKLALFFMFLFPLIFLFVFGSLNKGSGSISLNVAVINRSDSAFSQKFVKQLQASKVIKVNKEVKNFSTANQKMSRGEIDATIELPDSF